jgi:hypothetical protein
MNKWYDSIVNISMGLAILIAANVVPIGVIAWGIMTGSLILIAFGVLLSIVITVLVILWLLGAYV